MASRPLIFESLFALDICGANPNNWNKWTKLKFGISMIIVVTVGIEILIACIYDWKGLNSMADLAIVMAMYQVAFQLANLMKTRNTSVTLLRKIDEFWPINGYPTGLKNEIEKRLVFLSKCIKGYSGYVISLSFVYILKPLVTNTRLLPFKTYHPKNVTNTSTYYTAYALQLLMLYPSIPVVIGFGSLFVAFVINITTKLRILKEGISQLSINLEHDLEDEEALSQLYKIIKHHGLILRCIKDVDKIYKLVLLNLFLVNMILVCMSLLGLIADGFPPDLQTLFQYGMNATMYVGQLFFYCIMGSYLANETETVSLAIYQINWWIKFQPGLRKGCLLMITRANKPEQLTAGGMVTLNLNNFTKILRTILSFFTFMQAIYEDKSI